MLRTEIKSNKRQYAYYHLLPGHWVGSQFLKGKPAGRTYAIEYDRELIIYNQKDEVVKRIDTVDFTTLYLA